MNRNVGEIDRAVRIGAGAVAGLVSLAILADRIAAPDVLALLAGIAAVVLLATGYLSTCGLYAVLGVDTR
ncbi:YgaP family membrane protein [Halopenitus persicus]|uniref:Inner membrane protein YgaP-like transmembrane domain-containing protein n=1 Tax=Halopenitus persicus TaxID=1048396 RepID=A0A1H3MGK8_9EURY|nr:DUF2892 domain-containing protein [Halopenitus persicus]QHS16583.1 DUF2892 domain-containing protein [haloarchaeon 3A1-DGR]SDY75683.1 Protein of unknown function [Halopenitus persicus]